jgi:hypothetical protein
MADCYTYSNEPPATLEDGGFLEKFCKYDLFQGLIYFQVAKYSCSVYCVFHFLTRLSCVVFLTDPMPVFILYCA